MKNKFHTFKKIFERTKHETPIVPLMHKSGRVHGFTHKGSEFIHHSNLHHTDMAFRTVVREQKIILYMIAGLTLLAFLASWHISLIIIFSTLTIIYFLDLLFNAYVISKTFTKHPDIIVRPEEIEAVDDAWWPTYTIFCPLYKEWHVVPQFAEAMQKLDYPKDKLQIMFLLEENDQETIEKVRAANLPAHYEIVIVPHSKPKTKPKAMNYGLQFARGERLVVYDAEDVPDVDQLKKAALAFEKLDDRVICVQAKLNFYNPRQNVLTRIFTAEYSLWFDLVLPGFQSIFAPIPLGGTSNHFKTDTLRALAGWDAFNVTEDCDLGMRLSRQGFHTAIIDSTTLEEANSDLRNWYNQRSRWIKGYIQTYLVHMRKPAKLVRDGKGKDLAFFQFIVGAKVLSLFINPLMWVITICYFLFRQQAAPLIETLFPGQILTIGVFALIFGNFLYLYYYMIGCAKRGYNDLIKFVFIVPFYWLFMSVAAWRALYEVIAKPHYWAKTRHGLHLAGAPAMTAGIEEEHVMTRKQHHLTWMFIKPYLTSGASMLIASSLIANVFNFIFNAYLVRSLSLSDFGTITIISTFAYLLTLFVGALSTTVTHSVSFLEGKQVGAGNIFFRKKILGVSVIALLTGTTWLVATSVIANFFQVSNTLVIISFAPAIIFGALNSYNSGYLQGTFNFGILALLALTETITKLLVVIILIHTGMKDLAGVSIPASIFFTWLLSTIAIAFVYKKAPKIHPDAVRIEKNFPFNFYLAALMAGVSVAAFLSVDIIFAKHFLSPTDAGRYGILSLIGKMIFFFGSLLNMFVVTVVSRAEGKGQKPKKEFLLIFSGTAFLTIGAALGLSLLGPWLVPLLFGEGALSIIEFIPEYALSITLLTLSTTIVLYNLARKRYLFSFISLGMAIFMSISMMGNHSEIDALTDTLVVTNLIYFAVVVIAHSTHTSLLFIYRNIRDIASIFKKIPEALEPHKEGARILIFNWRDLDNVFAGGAEIYIQTMASHWVKEGHAVTLFCSNDGTQKQNEFVDGVRIIRRGGFFTLYAMAALYYIFCFRGKFDVIVDCENGIPFFMPLYAKEPVYCLVHHIHQEVFRNALVWPLSSLACFLERKLMPLIYRHSNFITVSESTKHDMEQLKITDKEISVVYPGVDLTNLIPGEKSPTPLVSYVGRLKDYKSVDLLIKAFGKVVTANPSARLIIAGDGDARKTLVRLVHTLKLTESVSFLGKVSEKEKVVLLQSSWVFVNPSLMEGWGITTIEANACGTPVIASNVPGLRDSVRNEETGILVPYGNIEVLANTINDMLSNEDKRKSMVENGIVWASHFAWKKSANKFIAIISHTHEVTTKKLETVVLNKI